MEGYIIGIIVACIILFLIICTRLLWKFLLNRQVTDSARRQSQVDPEIPPESSHSGSVRRDSSLKSDQHDIGQPPTPASSIRQPSPVSSPVPTHSSILPKNDSIHVPQPKPAVSSFPTSQYRPPAPCHVFVTSESGRAPWIEPLDLHGYPVWKAKRQTRHYLNRYSSQASHLQIITGRGLHSPGGIPRIKPAIEDLLDEEGYDYWEINKGGALMVAC